MDHSQLVLPRDRQVYPVITKEWARALNGVDLNRAITGPIEMVDNFNNFQQGVGHLLNWLTPIIDLSMFPRVYPCNGILGGMTSWALAEKRPIQILEGEFGWLKSKGFVAHTATEISELREDHILYVSNPFSGTGNFLDKWDDIASLGIPIVLDCAYLGTTGVGRKIEISQNIERVFFSFSKAFGVNSLRLGFWWSREKWDVGEGILHSGYFSSFYGPIIQAITEKFPVNYLDSVMRPSQKQICEDFQLSGSDSVLLACTEDRKYRVYERKKGCCRLALGLHYLENYKGLVQSGFSS